MHINRLEFELQDLSALEEISEIVSHHLSALRMNGQICGREWPIYREDRVLKAIVLTPDVNSLAPRFRNSVVSKTLAQLAGRQTSFRQITIAKDSEGAAPCRCKKETGYILFTNYLSLGSPLRCLRCFLPVPLYTTPYPPSGEYHDIISWQSDYQSCDSLQMNCCTLEKAATKQISDIRSTLTRAGLRIREELAHKTKLPVFYYLYRGSGRSLSAERRRNCPSCGTPWLLSKPIHSLFHFKCDRCSLVSNMAWNVAKRT